MDILFFLGLALALGFKHSYDADHLVAVSNLLSRSKDLRRTTLMSVSWAAGHMLTASGITVILFVFRELLLRPFLDAFEVVADFSKTSRGYSLEADIGHVTIVVDRESHQVVGAAMACPDASAAIHECVLAIKALVPVEVLAETIHAFPSTPRIFNGLFADALRELRNGAETP